MARFLGLDWDVDKLHMIETEANGDSVVVKRALSWPEPFPIDATEAEAAGRRLRTRLDEAGIAPAPVLACVGRDRIICRDVRYPDVPADEVAAIVRFQAMKEMTLPVEESVIDYSMCGVPWPTGEKRATALVLRKSILNNLRQACESAGLRLQCLSPRPIGLTAYLQAVRPGEADPHAVFALINGKGELLVSCGGEVLFSRSMAPTANSAMATLEPADDPRMSTAASKPIDDPLTVLLPELRRSLAAYASQFPRQVVRSLTIVGDSNEDQVSRQAGDMPHSQRLEKLQETLRLPVDVLSLPERMEPSLKLPHPWGAVAGLLGVIQTRHSKKGPGVDFLAPKEPRPPVNRKKQRMLVAAAVVGIVGLALGALYYRAISTRGDRIDELEARKVSLEKQIKAFGDVDKRIEAVDNWAATEIIVLDELYDLIAQFPDRPGMHITRVAWAPFTPTATAPTNGTAKTPIVKPSVSAGSVKQVIGKITLEAIADSPESLNQLRKALEAARHWKLELWEHDTPGPSQIKATLQVVHQEPADYQFVLSPPKNSTATSKEDPKRGRSSGNRPTGGRP